MDTKITYFNRLDNIFKKITESRLVSKKETDINSIKFFNNKLNETLPQTKEEQETKKIIRRLYFANNQQFRLLIKGKMDYLILLTSIPEIVNYFDIGYLVYIKLDSTYSVSLYNKYNQS
jgi:hypothetical protein